MIKSRETSKLKLFTELLTTGSHDVALVSLELSMYTKLAFNSDFPVSASLALDLKCVLLPLVGLLLLVGTSIVYSPGTCGNLLPQLLECWNHKPLGLSHLAAFFFSTGPKSLPMLTKQFTPYL